MANFTQITLNMAAGTGYVVSLGTANIVSVMARAACYVKTANVSVAPVAPTATPAPSSGLQATYLDMAAGEIQRMGIDNFDPSTQPGLDTINYLIVWAVGSGNLVINSH